MLGKLIKNDLKRSGRKIVNIYIAAFIAVAAMGISLFTDIGIAKIISTAALLVISGIAIIVTVVSMFTDFRDSVFGDAGYLTNTLPVRSRSMLFSKWLTSVIWILLSFIFLAFSSFLIIVFNEGGSSGDTLAMISEILPMLGFPSKEVLLVWIPLEGLRVLAFIAVNTAIVYFSVTVANIKPFQSLGVFGVIICFFVFFFAINYAGVYLDTSIPFGVLVDSAAKVSVSFDMTELDSAFYAGGLSVKLSSCLFDILAFVVVHVVNATLIEKKVNLK